MRAVFREEQKALPPPHPVRTSDRAPRRGLASTHTHARTHALTRRLSQDAGRPHSAARTCRPALGLLGTALLCASHRAAPPKPETRSRPRGGQQRGQDTTRPEGGGRSHPRGPGLTPACRRHRASAWPGGSGRRAGERRQQDVSLGAWPQRPQGGGAGGPTPQLLDKRKLWRSLGKDVGGPTATAQGHCGRPRLTSPGRRVRVRHVGDVPPGGGQLTQPASQSQETPHCAKVTLQPTDTAGSSRVPPGTLTVAGIGMSAIIITVARSGSIYSPTQLRVGTNVLLCP